MYTVSHLYTPSYLFDCTPRPSSCTSLSTAGADFSISATTPVVQPSLLPPEAATCEFSSLSTTSITGSEQDEAPHAIVLKAHSTLNPSIFSLDISSSSKNKKRQIFPNAATQEEASNKKSRANSPVIEEISQEIFEKILPSSASIMQESSCESLNASLGSDQIQFSTTSSSSSISTNSKDDKKPQKISWDDEKDDALILLGRQILQNTTMPLETAFAQAKLNGVQPFPTALYRRWKHLVKEGRIRGEDIEALKKANKVKKNRVKYRAEVWNDAENQALMRWVIDKNLKELEGNEQLSIETLKCREEWFKKRNKFLNHSHRKKCAYNRALEFIRDQAFMALFADYISQINKTLATAAEVPSQNSSLSSTPILPIETVTGPQINDQSFDMWLQDFFNNAKSLNGLLSSEHLESEV